MNRLIKLFQKKADDALESYTRFDKNADLSKNHPEIPMAAKVRAETWQAAADLLRKEELNK